jgi:FkbM family methyltransferase
MKFNGALEREMALLPRVVLAGRTAIDIGANMGLYSYRLSKLTARVEAFEPNINCAQPLVSFGASNVRIHHVALADHDGEVELNVPVSYGRKLDFLGTLRDVSGEHTTLHVPMRCLDGYGFQNVGFMKIDVEGFELSVLRGAEKTILANQPNLLIEVEQRHLDFPMHHVFDWLTNRGYTGWFFLNEELHHIAKFSYEMHQRLPFGSGHISSYVNNFIFVHEDSHALLQRP